VKKKKQKTILMENSVKEQRENKEKRENPSKKIILSELLNWIEGKKGNVADRFSRKPYEPTDNTFDRDNGKDQFVGRKKSFDMCLNFINERALISNSSQLTPLISTAGAPGSGKSEFLRQLGLYIYEGNDDRFNGFYPICISFNGNCSLLDEEYVGCTYNQKCALRMIWSHFYRGMLYSSFYDQFIKYFDISELTIRLAVELLFDDLSSNSKYTDILLLVDEIIKLDKNTPDEDSQKKRQRIR